MCKTVNGGTLSLFENSVASGRNTHGRLSMIGLRNLKRSVLCFLLGICVFLPVSCSSLQEAVIFIPVDPGQIPEGLTVTGPTLKGIEVYVRGPKSKVRILSDLKMRYVLDLSEAHIGINSIPIKKDRIILPEGISIVKINPTFLTVTIQNKIKKELPVKILFSGKPATGYTVSGAVAKPLSVILQGPENILGPMDKVLTKPIEIKGLSESFKKEVALDLVEDLEIISPSEIIFAEISIEEKIVTQNFFDIQVEGKNSPFRYMITPPAINIEVKGPVNIIEKLHTEKGITVYVDLKGLPPGTYVKSAIITLPVKTALIGVTPETFTVKISSNIHKK
ncbi:MAG: CdaR family protein [Desulfobacterales bacterium]|jgi:YbbR domain-containing protein